MDGCEQEDEHGGESVCGDPSQEGFKQSRGENDPDEDH